MIMNNKMKILMFLFSLLLSGSLYCGSFSNFKNITNDSLKSFTADIGGVIGGGINYSARSLGFSGFDVSYRGSYQFKPSHNNKIIPSKKAFGFDFIQVEIGMPYRIDGFIRAGLGEDTVIVGGGVKYGLWKVVDEMYKVLGIVVINSHLANYKDFYAIQYGIQSVFSMNCGNLRPYLAIGFDDTRLVIQNANDYLLVDKSKNVISDRYTIGLRWKINWMNFAAAYSLLHSQNAIEGGLGIRF